MMLRIPDNLQSVASVGGPFGLRWSAPEGTDIQSWQLVRCDYPLTSRNAAGLFSGGLDLMTTRWELHPSCTEVLEDTGVEGKNYLVLGILSTGQVYFPESLDVDPDGRGRPLSKEPGLQGWMKGIKKKNDRYSGMF